MNILHPKKLEKIVVGADLQAAALISSAASAGSIPSDRRQNLTGAPTPTPIRSGGFVCAHCTCLLHELGLCKDQGGSTAPDLSRFAEERYKPSVHTIPARRTIIHAKEWAEFVPVICDGWAVSSIMASGGRRQILSFLLPGDLVSTAWLFEPIPGRSIEAVTEVTYRKFKRADLKDLLNDHPSLQKKLAKIWFEERAQADQLALDLGRRMADQRIARLILTLAERLSRQGLMQGQTMDFPLRQRHIADATGLTPVHVSKVLGSFQRAGLITIGSRTLTILNEPDLRATLDLQ